MATVAINRPFSPVGTPARTKVLLLGSWGGESVPMIRARSLHIEHVSPGLLSSRGISRPAPKADPLALLRRWFFARKPDAGFLLTDFPATLLQAKVFDEWLDARGEALDEVLAGPDAPPSLIEHYETLGLLAANP